MKYSRCDAHAVARPFLILVDALRSSAMCVRADSAVGVSRTAAPTLTRTFWFAQVDRRAIRVTLASSNSLKRPRTKRACPGSRTGSAACRTAIEKSPLRPFRGTWQILESLFLNQSSVDWFFTEFRKSTQIQGLLIQERRLVVHCDGPKPFYSHRT
jgi:hypothetical protein